MKKFLKNKKCLLIAGDLLLIPALIACKYLSDFMLSTRSVCQWVRLGGKCITCGGTHFVNTLLTGQLAEAFQHNQFLFILTVYLAISYILLHLHWLAQLPFAKKALSVMYSIPALIVGVTGMMVFFLIRIAPAIMRIAQLLL